MYRRRAAGKVGIKMIKTVKTEGTGSLSLKPDLIRLNMTISGVRPEYDAVMQM